MYFVVDGFDFFIGLVGEFGCGVIDFVGFVL